MPLEEPKTQWDLITNITFIGETVLHIFYQIITAINLYTLYMFILFIFAVVSQHFSVVSLIFGDFYRSLNLCANKADVWLVFGKSYAKLLWFSVAIGKTFVCLEGVRHYLSTACPQSCPQCWPYMSAYSQPIWCPFLVSFESIRNFLVSSFMDGVSSEFRESYLWKCFLH